MAAGWHINHKIELVLPIIVVHNPESLILLRRNTATNRKLYSHPMCLYV